MIERKKQMVVSLMAFSAILMLLLPFHSRAFTLVPTTVSKTSTSRTVGSSLPLHKYKNNFKQQQIKHHVHIIPTHRRTALNSDSDNDSDNDDFAWRTELRERQLSFEQTKLETRQRWWDADFAQSMVGVPDWVRRVSVGQWPLAVCGSASGDVYVVNCESGVIVGKGTTTVDQNRYVDDDQLSTTLSTTLKQLYGNFDGGGTLAIAMSSYNIIAHAGRNGGVELWKIATTADNDDTPDTNTNTNKEEKDDQEFNELASLGTLLDQLLVTCLDWVEDDLWIGTQDGRVFVYTIDDDDDDDDEPSLLPSTPIYEFNNLGGGTILSLHYHVELEMAVAATSSGAVELLTMTEEDEVTPARRRSFYPPFDSGRKSSNVFPLCATIVEEEDDDDDEEKEEKDEFQRVGYLAASQGFTKPTSSSSSDNNNNNNNSNKKRRFSIACGGNDGSIFLKQLQLLETDDAGTTASPFSEGPKINWEHPFSDAVVRELVPSHQGPCKCVASPIKGLLLTGGQDGYVYFWDLSNHHTYKKEGNNTPTSSSSPTAWAWCGLKVWLGSLCVTDSTYLVTDGADNAICILNFGEGKVET